MTHTILIVSHETVKGPHWWSLSRKETWILCSCGKGFDVDTLPGQDWTHA